MENKHDLIQYNQRKSDFTPEVGRLYMLKSMHSRSKSDSEWSATAKITEIVQDDLYPYRGYTVIKPGIVVNEGSAIQDIFPIPEERIDLEWNVSGVTSHGQKLYDVPPKRSGFSEMFTEKPLNVDCVSGFAMPPIINYFALLLFASAMTLASWFFVAFFTAIAGGHLTGKYYLFIAVSVIIFAFLLSRVFRHASSPDGSDDMYCVDVLSGTHFRRGSYRGRRFSFNCRYGWETVGGQQVVIDGVDGGQLHPFVFGRVIASPAVFDGDTLISQEVSTQVRWNFCGFASVADDVPGAPIDFYDLKNKTKFGAKHLTWHW